MGIIYNILGGATEFFIITAGVITMWIFLELTIRSIR